MDDQEQGKNPTLERASETGEGVDARAGRPKPSRLVKAVAAGATLVCLWHVFASFLWIAPPSPLREIPSQKVLSSYMLPLFGQSWSVFAPEPINGDYHFDVRAVVDDGAGEVETDWVSATDVELSMIRYTLFPPRAGIQSTEVASAQMSAFKKLDAEQQEVVARDFVAEEGWRADMDRSFDALEPESPSAYLAAERVATAYATQVAYAIWGDEVVRVQYRVTRQNVVPFAQRHSPIAVRPEPSASPTGWRTPTEEPGQSRDSFAEVFRAQYERSTR